MFLTIVIRIMRRPCYLTTVKYPAMKYALIVALSLFVWITGSAQLKPYTLAAESSKDLPTIEKEVRSRLAAEGFDVVGSYSPATEIERRVLIITTEDLLSTVSDLGGLNGFLSALRVGLTRENGISSVSYTTPEYWGNAYLGSSYDEVEGLIESLQNDLSSALSDGTESQYGSKSGLEAEKLRKYNYMMGMPRFEDTELLATFDSHSQAIQTIESNLDKTADNIELVYSIPIPNSDLVLYGFGLAGEEGEGSFMPVIDKDSPRHTAFLPYEMLVSGTEVHMLHGRYRIALSFPDLKMGTFMKIVSTPKDIKRRLGALATPQLNR